MHHRLTQIVTSSIALAIIILLHFGTSACAQEAGKEEAKEEKVLTIGSKAPELDIEHWVSDGDGAFEHIEKFEKGKVYVVEFWATWCGPCVASMPHLSKIQEKYKKDGLQIISVSDEDLEKVEKFLERVVRGDEEKTTYAELTNNYCLTTDPDRSVSDDYMAASGQTGIPAAFIVGKTGIVEWVGHPASIDEPLDQVIKGKWNREEYAADFRERQVCEIALGKVNRRMAQGDSEGAADAIEEVLGKIKSEEYLAQMKSIRLEVLIPTGSKRAAQALLEFAKENKEDGAALNEMCMTIYGQTQKEINKQSEKADVVNELVKNATIAGEWAVQAEPESGTILDTLAHLYWVQGKIDKAIEIQGQAVTKEDVRGKKRPVNFLVRLLREKYSNGDDSEAPIAPLVDDTETADFKGVKFVAEYPEAEAEIQKIADEYVKKMKAFHEWRSKASQEEILKSMRSRVPSTAPSKKRLLELAKKHPNSQAELEALCWVAANTHGDPSSDDALDTLWTKYLDRESLTKVIPQLRFRIGAKSEACLRKAAKSPSKPVRSLATLTLGQYLEWAADIYYAVKWENAYYGQYGAPADYMSKFEPDHTEVESLYRKALADVKDEAKKKEIEAAIKKVRKKSRRE